MKTELIILCLGFFFQSCSDLKKGDQLSEIQGLLKTIDSVEVVLIENQIDTLENLTFTMRILQVDLAKLKAKDSIPLNLALKMDEYKWMRKSVPIIANNQIALKKGIKEVRLSLNELEVDISKASGRKDKYENYIGFEKKKVNLIRTTLTETSKLSDKLIKDFDVIHGEIVRYVRKN